MFNIAFVGNPNAGKTTWINYLSNSDLKVANYMGVSVEAQECSIEYQGELWNMIDLPGLYDLQVTNGEEAYAKEYLENHKVDLIVNVIDYRDLSRGLHLCAQLKHLSIPMVVLLNFVDKKVKNKDVKKLSTIIKTPILYESLNHREKILDQLREVVNNYKFTSFDERELYKLQIEKNYKNFEADKVLLHPLWGKFILIIILILSVSGIYLFTKPLVDIITNSCDTFTAVLLAILNLNGFLKNIVEALFFTFTSILSFLPFLSGVFLLIAVLEESGYIARIAYLLDHTMQHFNLSGRSVIPLLVGFGCNVPAIMATRTIENKTERYACALMIPFISCSAKLPIFLLFTSVFFEDMQIVVIVLLYALSIVMSLFIGALFASHKEEEILLLELPSYEFPKFNILWQKVKMEVFHFLKKVCKIMVISVLLLTFIFPFINVNTMQKAMQPLGFSQSYDAVESLPFGLLSKENLVVYYAQKKGTQTMRSYISSLWQENEKLLALCYLLYLSMSIPCIMTLAAIRSEFGTKFLLLSILVMFCIPFILTLIAYQGIQLLSFLF